MMYYVSRECQRQVLASLPVILNEFVIGLSYGWVAPALNQLQNNRIPGLSITTEQASWIGSLNELGRMFGPLICTPLLNHTGRKGVLTIVSVALFIAFGLVAFSQSVAVIYVSRIIFGIASGLEDAVIGIYLGENMKPTLRGALGSLSTAGYYFGTLMEFCLANYLAYEVTGYVNVGVAFLALSAALVTTETPEYLINKGRYVGALKNFLWLRDKSMLDTDAVLEFERLKKRVDEERREKGRTTIASYFSTPLYRKTICMVLVFCLLTNATGYDAIISYLSLTLTEDALSPNQYMMLFGICEFSAAVLSIAVIERVNRRMILVSGLTVAATVHTMTTLLLYARDEVGKTYSSWWMFATITTYSMIYSSSIYPIFSTIRGELLPYKVRSFGSSLSVIAHALAGFLTTKAFLLVGETVGLYGNFAFYAFVSVACLIFVYFVLPETRGKSLNEIQDEIDNEK